MSINKECCRCKKILFKSNFHKDNKRKDGVQRICIICIKQYHNNHKEHKMLLKDIREKQISNLNYFVM